MLLSSEEPVNVQRAENTLADREIRWRECLRQVGAGDGDSLARLYDESVPILYGLALRIVGNAADAEEVVVDVFAQVWRNAKKFDATRGSVWGWLTLLTRSRALDRLRAGKARREHEELTDSPTWDVVNQVPPPDRLSMFWQEQIAVRQAVCALPSEQREALELAYFGGLTHIEIAEALSVPLGTIKTRIRIAMDKLRVALSSAERSAAGSM